MEVHDEADHPLFTLMFSAKEGAFQARAHAKAEAEADALSSSPPYAQHQPERKAAGKANP